MFKNSRLNRVTYLFRSLTLVLVILGASFISACTHQSVKPITEANRQPSNLEPTLSKPQSGELKRRLKPDTLYDIFVADLASFRLDHATAAEHLLKQALLLEDESLFAEAAWHGTKSNDTLLEVVIENWSKNFPNSQELIAFMAHFFLDRGQALQALGFVYELDNIDLVNPLIHNISVDLISLQDVELKTEAERDIDAIALKFPNAYGPQIAKAMILWPENKADALTILEHAHSQFPNNKHVLSAFAGLLTEDQQFQRAWSLLETSPLVNGDLYLTTQLAKINYLTDGDSSIFQLMVEPGAYDTNGNWLQNTARWLLKHNEQRIADLYLALLVQFPSFHNQYWLLMAEQARLNADRDGIIAALINITFGREARFAARYLNQLLLTNEEDVRLKDWYQSVRATNPNEARDWLLIEALAVARSLPLSKAIHRVVQLSHQAPDSIELALLAFELYSAHGDFDSADAILEAFLIINPANAQARNSLAYGWLERDIKFEEALDELKIALALEPSSPEILDSYGWALFKMGCLTEALEYLTKANDLVDNIEIQEHLKIVTNAILNHQDRPC